MDRITRFSLKNSAVVMMAMIMVVIGGIYSGNQLKKETMPDVSIPIVVVVTPYPGAAPADVYDKVTDPLEQAISGVEGLKTVQSTSSDSVSIVVAEFSYSASMEAAENDVNAAIETVDLPENVIDPSTSRISMGSQPILKFAISGGDSAEELQRTVRDEVVPMLETVDGVGEVNVSNDVAETVQIVFDPDKLEDEGLTAQGVVQQLQASNLSFPIGSVEIDSIDQPIRVSGTIETVEALEEFQVAIYPDANAMYGDAFQQMGEGMGALGSAVGQLGGAVGTMGSAMGDLGQGVGDLGAGMGEMAEGLGMQIGMVSALQDVQSQLMEAKIQLTNSNSIMRDLESAGATDTPEYMAAEQTSQMLEQQVIPALEAAEAAIEAEMEAAMPAPPAGGSPSGPSDTMPGVSGPVPQGMAPPSGGSSSMEMGEMSIGLVRLGDIAEISYGASGEQVYSRADGQPAVLVDVVKTQDANTVETSKMVQAAMEDLLVVLPENTEVTYTYDGAVQIEHSISDMVREGLLGAIFAFLVILVFLRNWRSTLIAAVSIPLSVVISLLFMNWAGVTMNVMTLGGLTVAIGRVVDDSIVVIENIFHHLQAGHERTPELIRKATAEVSGAITSSTITTVAVFAPMALVSGIIGKIFTPFALTVAIALLSSLLVAVTLVPLLAKWSLLGAKVAPRDERSTRSGKAYVRALVWSLDHKAIVLASAAALFIGSLALVPIIGMGFMPPATENFIQVDVEYPSGSTSTDVDAGLMQLEDDLEQDDSVEFYTATVDSSSGFDMGAGITGANKGHLFIRLDAEADVDEGILRITGYSEPLEDDGASVMIAQVDMAGGSSNALDLIITGPTKEDIAVSADMIMVGLQDVEGLENVSSNLSESRPQITIDVDQEKAAENGLNAAMVAGTIRGYVAEQSVGFMEIDERDTEILYITALEDVDSAEDIANRTLSSPLGEDVRIGDIAEVETIETPVSVLTRNEKEYVSVTGMITERNTDAVLTAVDEEIAKLDLPDGVEVESGGVAAMMADSFEQLGLAMLVAIAAVYLVMVIAFGEAIAPLAIMFSLPLAIIGGIVGLLIAGMPLDMPAMIGALMLIGIVTTNAIVFIERVNQNLEKGLGRREALLDAGANRMRPILMTALTTICALLPLALGLAGGGMSMTSQSLAVIVVGGLTTSTALTLIVVPVIYDLLERTKERILGLDKDKKIEAA